MIPTLLVLAPVTAALLGLVTVRSDLLSRWVAWAGSAVLVLVALLGFLDATAPRVVTVLPPLRAGELAVPFHLWSSGALGAVALVVAIVSAAVQVYAAWYLALDDRYPQFAATVSLFTGAMLLVVHSHDLLLTLLGWEVMGWCSYLLIGHWSRKESARRAAHKSFLVTRVADIGFVLGLIGLATRAHSTDLGAVIEAWLPPECVDGAACVAPNPALRALLVSLVVIGVLGKSAQLPFSDWLPDAMEGPTPASALIHAATMVAAGTIVLADLFPVLAVSEPARWLLALATAATMLLAAVLAFAQSDLKRLLAWSTVSQVGVMLAALAAAPLRAGPDAGVFHLWSHALFKSLLFLALGWLAVLAGGTTAAALRGSGRRAAYVNAFFLVGLLGLAGAPFLVGGLSKEHVLAVAYDGAADSGTAGAGPGLVVLVATLLTVVVTAAYAARAYVIVGMSPPPLDPPADERTRDGTPPEVLAVTGLLALGTLLGGLVLLTGVFNLGEAGFGWVVLTLLLLGVGAAITFFASTHGDPARRLAGRFVRLADAGLFVDSLYRRTVAVPVTRLARVAARLDRVGIDGLVRSSAAAARGAARWGERAHEAERPSAGMALVVVGAFTLAGVIALVVGVGP